MNLNLESLVEEILDIAREQSHADAAIIIRDRIEKDVIRPLGREQKKQADTRDVERWKDDLSKAGWIAESAIAWRAPDGSLWRGPYGAWKELQQRNSVAAPISKPPRHKSKKELQAEELKRSDLTAQLAGRDDDIEYGPHDSLPRGEHIARLSKKDTAQKG